MFSRILLVTIALVCITRGIAQNQTPEHLSGFMTTSGTYKFSPKWMAYAELQARSIEKFRTIDYYEVKGGAGYNINDNNQAFAGMGRYATYKEKSLTQEELRLWLQYTFSHYISRIDLDHRLRAEERFFHYPKTGEKVTDQRYRYRLSTTLPINKKRVVAQTFFVNAFDEVFFGPNANAFKRNRVYAGAGYQFNRNVGMTTGYLWQRELSPGGNRSLHFVQLAVNFVIDRWSAKDKRIFVPVAD
ncbi:DUF2490 domain-containing protein [Niabella soli]|uniref:DUF2490 domain-containing protein n=1 Tax=Niabella soli DSM 19437 TaxID=929713 RepID=W0F402_9BACT|nr:DUF2490 domain-containing protein [Niabella soli]AHF16169.1 hypothetical protein NIASO_15460 [Niabella soli DSM 19437]